VYSRPGLGKEVREAVSAAHRESALPAVGQVLVDFLALGFLALEYLALGFPVLVLGDLVLEFLALGLLALEVLALEFLALEVLVLGFLVQGVLALGFLALGVLVLGFPVLEFLAQRRGWGRPPMDSLALQAAMLVETDPARRATAAEPPPARRGRRFPACKAAAILRRQAKAIAAALPVGKDRAVLPAVRRSSWAEVPERKQPEVHPRRQTAIALRTW
jgi:hypothetical protein